MLGEWMLIVLAVLAGLTSGMCEEMPSSDACWRCGCVPIPTQRVCPECKYPTPEAAPDPFHPDLKE